MRRYLLALMLLVSVTVVTAGTAHADASATVQNDSTWIDSAGIFHIFGEVKNTGDVWLRYVKIIGTLRDINGGIIDVVFTYTESMYLPPDSVSPFNLIEMDTAKAGQVQSYTLIVDQQEATPIARKLTILNVADSKNSLGWLQIVGEVQSQADQVSTYTKIIGTFYDGAGKVVYAAYTFTDPSDLPAGATYPFKMTILSDERTGKVARYDLMAESMNSGYTTVPEWPFPQLVAAMTVMAAVLVLKRLRVT